VAFGKKSTDQADLDVGELIVDDPVNQKFN
jgi:hypothetical protein